MQIKISVIAQQLGKSLDLISDQIKQQIVFAVKQLSLNTYAEAMRLANQRLGTSREDYLNSLKYQELPGQDIYVIYLEGDGSFFEKGWDAFDQKPGLINGPKSKPTKDGGRFNTIPFRIKATPGTAVGVTDTASAIQKIARDTKLDKIEKEIAGGRITTWKGIEDPMLKGLTRVTARYQTKTGKTTESSQYFVFRRVSDKSSAESWQHPGFRGAHIFPELKRYVKQNMELILKELL